MPHAVLVLNAGSSSIKFALFALDPGLAERPHLSGQIDGLGARPALEAKDASGRAIEGATLPLSGTLESQHHEALDFLLRWLATHGGGLHMLAAGHRVVHGGSRYCEPVRLSPAILEALAGFVPLAPLHQPHNLAAIRALAALQPELPQVACFDTGFHATQPRLATAFALPRRLAAEGIRRYGFHGLSYEYVASVLSRHLGERAEGRIVVAHLGNGASMCAMLGRRSIATTMGFTALDGLMMGTRTGAIDPGVLLHLMQYKGMDLARLTRLLYKESGLLGVSGISQDMRLLLASPDPAAREAVELFCYRIVRELGSLAAALGGLDALVFTAGIGEHAAAVREAVCRDSAWLGIELDASANARNDIVISTPESRVAVLVVPTNEEWMIARHTLALVGKGAAAGRG
ncbi:MAG: acetate/propionate family kinase [Rhodocyclaceae bacterium]